MSITIYGADWCEDTRIAREYLDSKGMTYRYVNIDGDEEAKRKVTDWNGGQQRTPTILLSGDGYSRLLSVPSIEELDAALDDNAFQKPNFLSRREQTVSEREAA